MKYNRIINILNPIKERSLFLLGPRQAGKTTLLQELFPSATVYDLLQANQFQELSADPTLIRQRLKSSDTLIVIDEVQKLPTLLDEVHSLIQRTKKLVPGYFEIQEIAQSREVDRMVTKVAWHQRMRHS